VKASLAGALGVALLLATGSSPVRADAALQAAIGRADLAAAGESLTRLGARVQAGAPVGELEAIQRALADGRRRLEALRRAEEERAGLDEERLAALLESERSQRLSYLLGVIDYWEAWALFGLAERAPADTPERRARQRERFAQASNRFARAAVTVREPAALRESGLARAVAQRRADRPEEAKETLQRLVAGFPDAPAEWRERVALEQMRVAAALGDRALVLRATEDAQPTSPAGVEQVLERLRILLSPPRDPARVGALRESLAALLRTSGPVASRALALVYEAGLEAREIAELELGAAGQALEGVALYRAGAYAAAAERLAVSETGALPAGLRGDVLLLYHADALARTGQPARAAAVAARFRRRFPASALRGEMARLAYGAALQAPDEPERLAAAAAWVIEAAPRSAEAEHARARRALTEVARVPAAEALRRLEAIPPGAPGRRPARIQRALLLSAQLQAALESEGGDAGRAARLLAGALDEIAPLVRADERAALAGDLALAHARVRAAAGDAEAALAALAAAPAGTERERTRLVALERGQRPAEAAATALALLRSPGGEALALRYALAAPERRPLRPEARRAVLELLAAARAHAEREGRAELELALLDREAALLLEAEPARAVDLYERYRERAPDSARALTGRARALEAAGRIGDALDAWDEVARRSEAGSSGWYEARIGVVRALSAQRPEEGCRVARSILELRADVPPQADAELRRLARPCTAPAGRGAGPPHEASAAAFPASRGRHR
jgi:hypothetical protein